MAEMVLMAAASSLTSTSLRSATEGGNTKRNVLPPATAAYLLLFVRSYNTGTADPPLKLVIS